MNPIRAVGRLKRWRADDPANSPYLGTCFAYRWQNRFLTAAHCIAGYDVSEIAIETDGGFLQTATSAIIHPRADVAVIECSPLQISGAETEPFWLTARNWALGEEVMAFGYPTDVVNQVVRVPTPRLFKGHFQRFIPDYEPHSGYKYLAGELNFGCPAGLSGGPVFRVGAHEVVLGIATEYLLSITGSGSYEEVVSTIGPVTKIVKYQEVIAYGTALMLSGITDWLDELCPPRDSPLPPASLSERLRQPDVGAQP